MPEGEGANAVPATFDEWYKGLPQGAKTLLDNHVAGLKNALQSQKDDNKALRDKLQTAVTEGKADAETRLAAVQTELNETKQRNTFLEGAGKLGLKNPKLAYIAAKDSGLLHEDGSIKEDKFREQFPELIGDSGGAGGNKKPATGAGAGTGGKPVGEMNWNDAVRASAGVVPATP